MVPSKARARKVNPPTFRLPSLVSDILGTPGKDDIETTLKEKDSKRYQAPGGVENQDGNIADWASVPDIMIY